MPCCMLLICRSHIEIAGGNRTIPVFNPLHYLQMYFKQTHNMDKHADYQ